MCPFNAMIASLKQPLLGPGFANLTRLFTHRIQYKPASILPGHRSQSTWFITPRSRHYTNSHSFRRRQTDIPTISLNHPLQDCPRRHQRDNFSLIRRSTRIQLKNYTRPTTSQQATLTLRRNRSHLGNQHTLPRIDIPPWPRPINATIHITRYFPFNISVACDPPAYQQYHRCQEIYASSQNQSLTHSGTFLWRQQNQPKNSFNCQHYRQHNYTQTISCQTATEKFLQIF